MTKVVMAAPQPKAYAHPRPVVLVVSVALQVQVCNLVMVGLLAAYGVH
nr:hypothetical protein [Tanacetum cinerariifolium]